MTQLATKILDSGVYLDRFRNPHGRRDAWQVFNRRGKLIAQDKERENAIDKAIDKIQQELDIDDAIDELQQELRDGD